MNEENRALDRSPVIVHSADASIPHETGNNEVQANGNACVICLESISEQAVALPCKHGNFDFICLISWLEEASTCPLCKAGITAVEYEYQDGKPKVYRVEAQRITPAVPHQTNSTFCSTSASDRFSPWVQHFRAGPRHPPRRFAARKRRQHSPPPSNEAILSQRKRIYELSLYSLHVGSNRLSGYSDLTPTRFANDPHLVSRASKWLRRELQVFDFLSASASAGTAQESLNQKSSIRAQRASQNAEFLLEYIVAILKTVDIKGSKGQAQEMLAEFLGEKAALFLHELNSWLRSPFEDLAVWDRNVRYEWPEGEENPLKRRSRTGATGEIEQQSPWEKRRRLDRWIPD